VDPGIGNFDQQRAPMSQPETAAEQQNLPLREQDLRGIDLSGADLRQARLRMMRSYKKSNWIGVDIHDINVAEAYLMRREIIDQNFFKEFRSYNKLSKILYYPWMLTCDCGRSMFRWCCCIVILLLMFAKLYSFADIDYGSYETLLSPFYFSVVTMTTLGFGDATPGGQIVTMLEVSTGYIMLGGLLSIFSNKLARRGD